MAETRNGLYDAVISFFNETDESLAVLEILLLKLCSTEHELNLCFNHVYNYKHKQRCTTLMIAVLEGRINLVKMLLSKFRKSINLETKGTILFYSKLKGGVTALWMAAARENFDILKLLIENGAEVNTVSNYDATPLHLASTLDRIDIVKYLIEEAHGDVNRVNKGNVTCLNLAGGNFELMEYLLQQPGVDVNHQSNNPTNGYTTLHWAVEHNKIEAVKLLLSCNARVDIKNAKNVTPLEMAADDTNEEVVKYMLSIENLIGIKDRIEALELLGASFASREKETYNLEKTYEYIMQAMELRISSGNVKTSLTTLVQPISAYNYRTECVSIDELESIHYEYESLRIEALLIRERLLPPTSCTELIYCIWFEGWMYADQQMYDRCIHLWFHGLELSTAINNVAMSGIDPYCRVMYISIGLRNFGELFCEMLSTKWKAIPTTIFLEILKFAINQFRHLCQKPSKTERVPRNTGHDHYVFSILFLIHVSTKLNFKEDEQQQLHKLIQWINRLNIRRKFRKSTLLHICCDSTTVIDSELQQNEPSFPCTDIIQLLIECNFGVNSIDRHGNTPLHILLRKISDSKLSLVEPILNIFLNTGQLHMDYINQAGMTPLDCTSNTHLIELLTRKTNRSLKCLCAKRLNQSKIIYQNCLSQNLIDFVKRHKQ